MKALHLTLSYQSAPALGGPDLTAYKLCTALRKQGVKVDVICTNLASKNTVISKGTFEKVIDGVHVTYLTTRKIVRLGRSSFGLYYLPELRSLLNKIVTNYDVVHLQGYRDYVSVIGYWSAYSAGVPFLVHPRGTVPFQGHSILVKSIFDRMIGRRMLSRAATLIALSQREIKSFLDLGAPVSKIEVVHNGIEGSDYEQCNCDSVFREKHKIHEKHIILYFGRVHIIKGIDHMVRAVASMCKKGWDICAVVIGPDEGYGTHLKRIARQEKFDHLYILPTVSGRDAKQEVFASADALVYAAAVEDFGVSAFEGILSGVPTIVAADTGCGEIVRNLDAGFVVRYGDVSELERVLTNILSNSNKAREFTLAARERVEQTLDWTEVARKVRNIYESCTDK